ncbi:Uncharacterised protein [uncultured archaeon]|nr:Uncharacterised protein [uncultured archaeon]
MSNHHKAEVTCKTFVTELDSGVPVLSGVTCTLNLADSHEKMDLEFVNVRATDEFQFNPADFWSPVVTNNGMFALKRKPIR